MPNQQNDLATVDGELAELEQQAGVSKNDNQFASAAAPGERPFHSDFLNEDFESELEMKRAEYRAALLQANSAENPLDNLSDDDIRSFVERENMNDRQRAADVIATRAAQEFLEWHPEFVQNGRNATLLEEVCKARGLEIRSAGDIEDVYVDLANKGLVEIDAKKLAEQEREAAAERAQAKRRRSGLSSRGRIQHVRETEDDVRQAVMNMSDKEFAAIDPFSSRW